MSGINSESKKGIEGERSGDGIGGRDEAIESYSPAVDISLCFGDRRPHKVTASFCVPRCLAVAYSFPFRWPKYRVTYTFSQLPLPLSPFITYYRPVLVVMIDLTNTAGSFLLFSFFTFYFPSSFVHAGDLASFSPPNLEQLKGTDSLLPAALAFLFHLFFPSLFLVTSPEQKIAYPESPFRHRPCTSVSQFSQAQLRR